MSNTIIYSIYKHNNNIYYNVKNIWLVHVWWVLMFSLSCFCMLFRLGFDVVHHIR